MRGGDSLMRGLVSLFGSAEFPVSIARRRADGL
jgi:hypothetical protein